MLLNKNSLMIKWLFLFWKKYNNFYFHLWYVKIWEKEFELNIENRSGNQKAEAEFLEQVKTYLKIQTNFHMLMYEMLLPV